MERFFRSIRFCHCLSWFWVENQRRRRSENEKFNISDQDTGIVGLIFLTDRNEFFPRDVNTVLVAGLRIILKIYEPEFMIWTKIIGTNPLDQIG